MTATHTTCTVVVNKLLHNQPNILIFTSGICRAPNYRALSSFRPLSPALCLLVKLSVKQEGWGWGGGVGCRDTYPPHTDG